MSNNFSFSTIKEEASNGGKRSRISTGIHDCLIQAVTLVDVTGKDGNPDWKKVVVEFKATKSYQGENSEGLNLFYDIKFPNNQENSLKLGKRLMHIFNKVGGKNKITEASKYINEMSLPDIETIHKQLTKFVGKSVRLKIVADQNRKYPIIPFYFTGYAEATDVDFKDTTLFYDEKVESTIFVKDVAKVEQPANTPAKSDDLPF